MAKDAAGIYAGSMARELSSGEYRDVMRAQRSITEIRSFVDEEPYARIASDRPARAAFERLLQMVSDASRPVAARWKGEYPAVQWSMIGAVGDELHYAYDAVDLPTLWAIYERDLDPLEAAIDAMLAAHAPKDPSP